MNKLLHLSCVLLFLLASCDKEITISSPPEPVPQGFLYVQSRPSGFTVYLNGRNTGRTTPDSLPYIAPGNYSITLKKANFKDTTITTEVVDFEKRLLSVDYFSNPSMLGSVLFKSIPEGAGITFNDSNLAVVTPYQLNNILPGEYTAVLKKLNYRDATINLIIKSSNITTITPVLKDTSVWVDYQQFNSGLPNNILTTIASDNNGVKWIGTGNSGLIRFNEQDFILYNTTNSSIPSNNIKYVNVDKLNRVWVCTDNGIGIFDGNSWINYNTSNSKLLSNNVNVVKFSNDGSAWIGTQANLVKYSAGSFTSYNYNTDQVKIFWINDIAVENDQTIWLCTAQYGIIRFDGNSSFTVYQKSSHDIVSNSAISVDIEFDGTKWFINNPMTSGGNSYRGGISTLKNGLFTAYTPWSASLVARNIFIDRNNNKWVSTKEGIYRFTDPGHYTIINRATSDITSNDISQVIQDENNITWIATLGGGLIKYKGN